MTTGQKGEGLATTLTLAMPVTPELIDVVAARVVELMERCPENPGPDYLTPAEAAEYMRAKRGRIYELLAQGHLTRLKDGSRTLVRRSEIDEYLAA